MHSDSAFEQSKTQKIILTQSISPFRSLMPAKVTQDFHENFCCLTAGEVTFWGVNALTRFNYKHIHIIYIACVLVRY